MAPSWRSLVAEFAKYGAVRGWYHMYCALRLVHTSQVFVPSRRSYAYPNERTSGSRFLM